MQVEMQTQASVSFERKKHKGAWFGFSLVEVCIAMGLVSFAVVGLIGVMPVGLTVAQESGRQTIQANIVRQISSDLGMLPRGDLSRYSSLAQIYDNNGRKVDERSLGIYEVSIEVEDPHYPSSGLLEDINSRIERVVICIRRIGEPDEKKQRIALPFTNSGT